MLRILALATAALGCGQLSTALAQTIDAIRPQLEAYVRCNVRQALAIAGQQGGPLELGRVANSMCPREENALITILQQTHSPRRAYESLMLLKRNQVERNAAHIVRSRAAK